MRRLAACGLVTLAAGLVLAPACHNVPADKFLNAVVDCAKVNPQASAALAQVETCLVSAVSGNPAACLSGLITDAHFTVDEVACVVAERRTLRSRARTLHRARRFHGELQPCRAFVDPRQLEAAHPRHPQLANDEVERLGHQHPQRSRARNRRQDFRPPTQPSHKDLPPHVQKILVVIHQ